MKEIELKIDGMTCHHCTMAVRKELSRIQGVRVDDVRLGSARVSVDENTVSVDQLRAAIREAGYTMT